MKDLYAVMGISRQAVHKAQRRVQVREERHRQVLEQVHCIRSRHPRMGSRPLYTMLEDPQIGITAFERMMSGQNLTVPRKRKRIVTTQTHADRRYPNLTNGLIINEIDKLIVGDITYWENSSGLYYVYSLKDMYSKRLVGLHGAANLRSENALVCLEQLMLLRRSNDFAGTIHHTDGGSQYRSDLYLQQLNQANFSISQAYSCLENGAAEQCHDTVKNQYLLNEEIQSTKQLNEALARIQYLINHERPVESLGYLTPAAFEHRLSSVLPGERKEVHCYDFTIRKSTRRFSEAFTSGMQVDTCVQKNQPQSKETRAEANGIPEDR